MSARFIVIPIGVALVMPFFFLPRGIFATALLILGGIALLMTFGPIVRQIINDARWMTTRVAQRHSQQPFNRS